MNNVEKQKVVGNKKASAPFDKYGCNGTVNLNANEHTTRMS